MLIFKLKGSDSKYFPFEPWYKQIYTPLRTLPNKQTTNHKNKTPHIVLLYFSYLEVYYKAAYSQFPIFQNFRKLKSSDYNIIHIGLHNFIVIYNFQNYIESIIYPDKRTYPINRHTYYYKPITSKYSPHIYFLPPYSKNGECHTYKKLLHLKIPPPIFE